MPDEHILVVGTTSDYIEMIRRRFPDRSIFLTDVRVRAGAAEPRPPAPTELLCDLARVEEALAELHEHIRRYAIKLDGIACFDCESMWLAAQIARALSFPYASPEAVLTCRNKYASKTIWHQEGLPCPEADLVGNESEVQSFLNRMGGRAVLKPLAGSGGEYVFTCSDDGECAAAFRTITSRLASLRDDPGKPLYSRDGSAADAQHPCVVEELIQGDEYSCDFVLDGDRVEIVRIARKVPERGSSFGTTLAYVVPATLPPPLSADRFRCQLRNAAQALGLKRAVCMLDFIVCDGEAKMIEMTPRPGGDCLPPLLLRSAGFDMLGFAMDFAGGHVPCIPEPSEWKLLVGLRLFANAAGIIASMDAKALKEDRRVTEYHLQCGPGHEVVLPPEDYDSRVLGHVIFEPSSSDDMAAECAQIAELLEVEMEQTP